MAQPVVDSIYIFPMAARKTASQHRHLSHNSYAGMGTGWGELRRRGAWQETKWN